MSDPTAHVLAEVRRLRRVHGWTQPEFADLCQRTGLDWNRSIVANVEGGRRDSVTVHELVVLAEIFGVPVMSLISDQPCCESNRIVRQVRGLVGQ